MNDKNDKQEVLDEINDTENEQLNDEVLESVEDEKSEINSLKERLELCEDRYIRAHADFENIKKRLEKERYQAVDYANEIFARDMLSIADTLEIAYKSIGDDSDEIVVKIKEGIALTLEQFKKVFEKHGVKSVEVAGKFDPNIHDAMMKVDSDTHESGDIVQCFQKGYMIKDRVLRPAMVSVAK